MWINYYYKNQDKILSDAKQRRLKNIDKFKLKDKLYNINNKDKIKIRRDKNRERDRKRDIKYYNKNRSIILEKHRIYNSLNKEKLAKYKRDRKHNDINFKLRQDLSSMVSNSLKKFLIGKEYNNLYTIELTGCSMEKLKQHLEKQFKPGMSWNNWSQFGWHIDHIKPRALFNLMNPEEQRKCFHYTNLQPLWAEENLSKGDRYYG